MTLPGAARAEDAPMCRPVDEGLSLAEHLRAISLDLRGTVPTAEEFAAVAELGEIPEQLVDEWMEDPRFIARVVRRHRELLWPNVEDQVLVSPMRSLGTRGDRWYVPKAAGTFRNASGYDKRAACDDKPATFAADGSIEYEERNGVKYEGWVEVTPYWDPSTTIKVCAFDAQDRMVSSSGARCDTRSGQGDPECGCGPNLIWCAGESVGYKGSQLTDPFREDFERRIAAVLEEHEPYTALFTSRRAFVNGPLVHYLKHLVEFPKRVSFDPLAYDIEALPDLAAWEGDTFEEIELSEHHAGILTSPLYLLRFQTNRARANRFFESFLCSPFYAPSGSFVAGDEESAREPDLQKRAGCNVCHAVLEPSAAYWGRWPEQGAGFLDPATHPMAIDECVNCRRCDPADASCNNPCLPQCDFYVRRKDDPFAGMLEAARYMSELNLANIDGGPRAFVEENIDNGRLPSCVARRTVEWLLGRGSSGRRTNDRADGRRVRQDRHSGQQRRVQRSRTVLSSGHGGLSPHGGVAPRSRGGLG